MSKRSALANGNGADQGHLRVREVRGQERTPEQQARSPGATREQEAEAHPAHRQDPQARLYPVCPASHVLQDERDRHGDAGDESAPGQVVAPQEQEHGRHADHREQQPHDQRGDGHHILDGIAFLSIRTGLVIDVLDALLFRDGMLSGAGRNRRSRA